MDRSWCSTVTRVALLATAVTPFGFEVAAQEVAPNADLPMNRALARIPEDAAAFLVVPSLKALSDDLAQLVEATGQGGLLSMARPIDLLKGQLGVGANLDEKGPLVAYFPASMLTPTRAAWPVIVFPVTDGAAFLAANLIPAPEQGETAYKSAAGLTVFARALEGCVVLAPSAETLPAAAPTRGIGDRFHARLKPAESAWLTRADLVGWASRDALHAMVEGARAEPAPLEVFGILAEQQAAIRAKSFEVADMLADAVFVVDVDPMGLFFATVAVAEPTTPLASAMAGGEGKPARFDRLPSNPFYFALSVDLDGLGGAPRFGELLDLCSIPRTLVPEWVFTEGADLQSLQFAAYPSILGVAIGGVLNDSALFIGSRNPARTKDRLRQSIESAAGEADGVRRTPLWTAQRTLSNGEVVSAFEIKETVFDATKRPGLDLSRLAKQFIFGARGLGGLVQQRDDGLVVTFSARTDVLGRAKEAASGTKSLAGDDTVKSIQEWLPEQRDVEVMVGVGPLVHLVAQIASSFVGADQVKAFMPKIDKQASPVAMAVEVGQGRAASVFVLPAEVLKAMADLAARQSAAMQAPAAPPTLISPTPSPTQELAPAPPTDRGSP